MTNEKILEEAEMKLAEYIDGNVYLPVKAELAGKGITHSLGMRKEGLKEEVHNVIKAALNEQKNKILDSVMRQMNDRRNLYCAGCSTKMYNWIKKQKE